jgi:spiro-SPASM protein
MKSMDTIVFVNALSLSPYAFRSLPGGTSFSLAVEAARRLPGAKRIVILSPVRAGEEMKARFRDSGQLSGCEVKNLPDTGLSALLRAMHEALEGERDIFYLFADTPLIDSGLAAKMYENHRKYFAEYTFADGYPLGLSVEILASSILKRLIDLADRHPAEANRDGLFGLIQKDINSFDLETEISPVDLRMLRVSLSADSKRNHLLLSRVMNEGGRDAASVTDIIRRKPEILRTLPAFASIQIASGCPQACSYCPYPASGIDVLSSREEMRLSDYLSILLKLKELSDDLVVSVSLWGEPSLHSDIAGIISETVSIDGFRLIIETSGIGWSEAVLDEAAKLPQGKIDWILSLDAHERQLYKTLRGSGFDEAFSFFDRARVRFPSHVWVQAVRMAESEEKLESFYRFFKEKTAEEGSGGIIIQKYDSFCGFLPGVRLPISRLWSVFLLASKRDLSVLLDGSIPLCREDLKRCHSLGNILSEAPKRSGEGVKNSMLST